MNLYETVYVVRQDIRPEELKPIEDFLSLSRFSNFSSIDLRSSGLISCLIMYTVSYKFIINKKTL